MPALPWVIGAFLTGGVVGTVLGVKTEKIVGAVVLGGVTYYLIKGRRT